MVRRVSRPLHPLRPAADLGHESDARRTQAARREGLHGGLDQREPEHAGSAEHSQRIPGAVLEEGARNRQDKKSIVQGKSGQVSVELGSSTTLTQKKDMKENKECPNK